MLLLNTCDSTESTLWARAIDSAPMVILRRDYWWWGHCRGHPGAGGGLLTRGGRGTIKTDLGLGIEPWGVSRQVWNGVLQIKAGYIGSIDGKLLMKCVEKWIIITKKYNF